MTIRVVVADDQALVRAGLAGIVGTAPDLTVVGQAASGRNAVRLVQSERADVVLMDIRMPDTDGLQATKEITTSGSAAKVLILTTFDLDEYVFAALSNGASGFLLKDTPPPELLAAIRVIAGGDALLAPGVTRRLIDEYAARRPKPTPGRAPDMLATITNRELEVLRLIAAGMSNREIAQSLHIGEGTAKTHVGHLLTKLAARDRVQLVILAHRAGLSDAEE